MGERLLAGRRYFMLQDQQWVECITCGLCTQENKYSIVEGREEGVESFTVEEQSSFACRLCCAPFGRAFSSKISAGGRVIGECKRDCQCTAVAPWLCMCRPEVKVFKDGREIGTIVNPCFPLYNCKLELVVKTGDQILWTISVYCLQYHVCCALPCGPCMEMDINVEDEGKNPVGYLKKYFGGCLETYCTAADRYEFTFPDENDETKQALFLAALQFFDMLFFEPKITFCGQ